MKLHLTAKMKGDSKVLDGGCRIVSLPKQGFQKIRVQDLMTRFKPFTELVDDTIVFHTVDGDVEFKIGERPNPASKSGGSFTCSVVKTTLTKSLMGA